MKLCPQCSHSPLPFVMVFTLSLVISFVTWLMIGLSSIDPLSRYLAAGVVFIAVGTTLLHYVLSCLKRHCRHQHHAQDDDGARRLGRSA